MKTNILLLALIASNRLITNNPKQAQLEKPSVDPKSLTEVIIFLQNNDLNLNPHPLA